jgi:hypothetical protein
MTLTDQITFGLACLGSFLGLLSFIRDWQRDRIQIRVTPMIWLDDRGNEGMSIDVINLGAQTVTVSHVGLAAGSKDLVMLRPMRYAGCEGLPHRLESRAALTVYWFPGAENDPKLAAASKAFVQTACGRRFTGTSPALKAQLNKLRLAALAKPPRA